MKLTHLMIHCSDTPANMDVRREHIEQWHLVERGWSKVGYSDLICLSGMIEHLIPYNDDAELDPWEISNGAKGWNGHTRHICYAGGKGNIDTRTQRQQDVLLSLCLDAVRLVPGIKIIGHNQVNAQKYCPSFDVPSWCLNMDIPENNIDFNVYY